ncbi:MAG: glycosyltransferase family 2 protein [bacterium]
MPKVFIIVLNWNGLKDTEECIESLKKIDYPDYKIVVVDNGSTDGSDEIIPKKHFQDVAFIETKSNLGFAGGNNIGIKHALDNGADYILLLNNDTTVEPDFLSKLVKAAEGDKKIGIVGPMIFFYDEPDRVWFGGGKINWSKIRGSHLDYNTVKKRDHALSDEEMEKEKNKVVDYITGCCLLIKREVVEKIGYLNDDYFLYYEDADWCMRAKKAGWQSVVVPASYIYHKQSKSTVEFSYPYIYYHSRNGLLFASRFGSKPLAYLISFWIFGKQIIKLVFSYHKAWAKAALRGVLDFWMGNKGKLGGYY